MKQNHGHFFSSFPMNWVKQLTISLSLAKKPNLNEILKPTFKKGN